MFGKVLSAFMLGMEAKFIYAEVDVSEGMPAFEIVGFLNSEVREARERVRTGLKNSGVKMPSAHFTVNLSPADVKKRGTGFDLAIALGLLQAMGHVREACLENVLVLGEISLDGAIHPVRGVLPLLLAAREKGIRTCILPSKNLREGALVEGMYLCGADSLEEVARMLREEGITFSDPACLQSERGEPEREDAMGRIAGQEMAKRAALVAAAGFHNLLLIGPPGTGKTMLAKSVGTLLPPLSAAEELEVTKVYSVAGLLDEESPLVRRRPFRSPHHTVTAVSLSGGGRVPRPGEITLAHGGVLFLDELPEYNKNVLETLRQPMEEGKIRLSRSLGTFEYPANFLLVAAMNPCRCGYYPDYERCRCTAGEVRSYLSRISGPLLDRIDVCAEMQAVTFQEMVAAGAAESGLEQARERDCRERLIERAVELQKRRYANENYSFNSQLPPEHVPLVCRLGDREQEMLGRIYVKYGLTARSYHKILKVARTIADLEGETDILCRHVREAVGFRTVDERYWGRR